jgi:hypothetical protein
MSRYCTVRVRRQKAEGMDEQIVHPPSFDELLIFLKQVRDQHAEEYADWLATLPESERSEYHDTLGGMGVDVTNRWGGVVEVGPGQDVWFLFRSEPPPGRYYSDNPPIQGTRVFYLDGGHHTELTADMLVSQKECLRVLQEWLDTGVFPESA